jgi:hypothetical protein
MTPLDIQFPNGLRIGTYHDIRRRPIGTPIRSSRAWPSGWRPEAMAQSGQDRGSRDRLPACLAPAARVDG